MSFTKTVFYVPSASTATTLAPPAKGDAGLSIIENDAFQANAGVALAAGDTFQIVNGFYNSARLKYDDIVSKKTLDAAVGTAQKIKVTTVLGASDSDTPGAISVKLINVTDGREKFSIKTFEAAGTIAVASAAVAAAILKDVNVSACAATSAGVITITFVKDVVYRAAANAASSVAYTGTGTALMVASVGQPAEVKAALAEGMAFQGVTNQGGTNIVSPGFAAAVACDKIVVEVNASVGDRSDRHELVFYVAAGSTAAFASLETVFGL